MFLSFVREKRIEPAAASIQGIIEDGAVAGKSPFWKTAV